MADIDINMVHAGVDKHTADWGWSGYCEIQSPPQHYTVIDRQSLMKLLDIIHYKQLQQHHKGWGEDMLLSPSRARDPLWSNSIAVGSREYIGRVKDALGISAKY